MRKLFALILIALLLGVGVVALIETEPGYLLVSYGNYTLESSLWVGLLLLLLLTLLIYAGIGLLRRLAGGRKSVTGWLGARRTRLASGLSTRGHISFIEGDWTRARRQLLRGARNNEAPLVNYLMAAQASNSLGEPEKVQAYLGAAADLSPEAAVAVAITRAEIRLQAGQYDQALEALQGVRRSAGRSPHVLDLLRRVYHGQGDWQSLARLLPDLKKSRVLSADTHHSLEREVYTQLLEQSSRLEQGSAVEGLQKGWQKLPAALKQDSAMLRRYVALLLDHEGHTAAEKVILKALKHKWDSGLVRMYGYVQGEDVPRQLAQAERWLPTHSEDAQLLLCLGRLAARDKLWGKARDYFESSYRLERSAETCAELGRLLNALGEAKVAAAYFREGLMMQENNLPTLPQPEKMVRDRHLLASS